VSYPPGAPRTDPLGRVTIVGLGLIGGSIGLALRRASVDSEVVGWDVSPEARIAAIDRGAVTCAPNSLHEAVSGARLVVLCVPVDSSIPLLREIVPHLSPDAVVTDVGSTKARICAEAASVLPGRFVGGHPMAGSEVSGIDGARADLFDGANWFATALPDVNDDALDRVERFVWAVGANIRRFDPAVHDRIVAAVSHLPHLLAFALSEAAANRVPQGLEDAGAGSFRDGTRVAASSPRLWSGILTDNAEEIVQSLDEALAWLTSARAALVDSDRAALEQLLEQARAAKDRFPQ
jgi:prephenate dehydrogenase